MKEEKMPDEVRYAMLRPRQVVERRTRRPVAYVPIGTLEWHGPQNPLGADTLQAEGLALLCARRGGGLVFPPLYYGESRSESLMEANAADRENIAAAMDLPPANFAPDRQPFSPTEQVLQYQRLLLHVLAEVESLGFALGVLVAGHYPLVDHARAAVLLFNKRHHSKYHGMLAWACVDYLFLQDRYAEAGDHAGGWETSHLLALHPETVDLSALPPKGDPLTGIMGSMAPQDATAEFGRRTLEESADAVLREVDDRMANPARYRQHGWSLREGLWKNPPSS
jgi:creatinine amidohydrolase